LNKTPPFTTRFLNLASYVNLTKKRKPQNFKKKREEQKTHAQNKEDYG
jgi:hypothetical protein